MDDKPYWDYEHNRWLCRNAAQAMHCHDSHPDDAIYLYDRNEQQHMTNIKLYWSLDMPDTRKQWTIRNGRLH